MRPASKKIIEDVATILNKHLAQQTPVGKVLALNGAEAVDVTDLVNEILGEIAEGARLVTAVETSGELLGFVPRFMVPIPEQPHPRPAPSPEDQKP